MDQETLTHCSAARALGPQLPGCFEVSSDVPFAGRATFVTGALSPVIADGAWEMQWWPKHLFLTRATADTTPLRGCSSVITSLSSEKKSVWLGREPFQGLARVIVGRFGQKESGLQHAANPKDHSAYSKEHNKSQLQRLRCRTIGCEIDEDGGRPTNGSSALLAWMNHIPAMVFSLPE